MGLPGQKTTLQDPEHPVQHGQSRKPQQNGSEGSPASAGLQPDQRVRALTIGYGVDLGRPKTAAPPKAAISGPGATGWHLFARSGTAGRAQR